MYHLDNFFYVLDKNNQNVQKITTLMLFQIYYIFYIETFLMELDANFIHDNYYSMKFDVFSFFNMIYMIF